MYLVNIELFSNDKTFYFFNFNVLYVANSDILDLLPTHRTSTQLTPLPKSNVYFR